MSILFRATASFLLLNQTVRTELLQTTDHGLNWTQLAPGEEFIPLGPPGAFDSYTTYTSWSGGPEPLLDPKNQSRTLFYYSGGDGPHDGQRDDSIGLAYATTNGYAGLTRRAESARPADSARLVTSPLVARDNASGARSWQVLASVSGAESRLRVRQTGAAAVAGGFAHVRARAADPAAPLWADLEVTGATVSDGSFEFDCAGDCTLFALRAI